MSTTETPTQAKLTDEEREQILDRLDAPTQSNPGVNRRGEPRYRLRQLGVKLNVVQPGGSTIESSADLRNMSAHGFCMLYRGFLHKDTTVSFSLFRLNGTDSISGKVIWCNHVGGVLHLVGFHSDERLHPRRYTELGQGSQLIDSKDIDPTQITGKLLLVEELDIEHQLFCHYLNESKLDIIWAKSVDEARELTAQARFDLIFCDLMPEDETGAQFIRDMRTEGVRCPIVALTAESDERRLRDTLDAGASVFLMKPYSRNQLYGTLMSSIEGAGLLDSADALCSSITDPELLSVVVKYIEYAKGLASQLQAAVQKECLEAARSICQALRGSGSSFGFEAISEAAQAAVLALDASMSVSESHRELGRLHSIASRVRLPEDCGCEPDGSEEDFT